MSSKIDLGRLERQLDVLSEALAKVNSDEIKQVLLFIHRPGWTTPAELLFATGITDAMIGQVKILQDMSAMLVRGSGAVSAKEQ